MSGLRPDQILNELIKLHPTAKAFARAINEDGADITRWRNGRCAITPRAVISICRLHPHIKPFQLNSACFPEDLTLIFGVTNE